MPGITRGRAGGLAIGVVLLFVAADWNQFRGPSGDGWAPSESAPTQWSPSEGIRWKAPLPGRGTSSPIVWGSRIYLTCYTGYGQSEEEPGDSADLQRHVLCFERDSGELVWDTPFSPVGAESPYEGFQALHGFASSTPVTDGESVFVFFGRSGVAALTMDGQERWSTNVGDGIHGWGSATSPILHEDLVIVNASVESESLVALEKSTGKVVWTEPDITAAWNTPTLVEAPDGTTELVVNTKTGLVAFQPATGERLWWCEGFDDYICPSLISRDGIVYAIGARKNTAMAVRTGGRGDVTETHLIWKTKKGSNVSSPVLFQNHLYWVHESRGIAYCLNADSGNLVYEERLKPRPGKIYASPVVADGNLYIVSRDKGSFVLAASPEFQLIAHNPPLDPSIFNGSPAVANGKLLVRSDEFLYCLE